MKKVLSVILCICLILGFAACGSSTEESKSSSSSIESKNTVVKLKPLELGDQVNIATDNGEVNFSIDETSWTGWEEYEDSLKEGQDILLLNCVVENISYYDEDNQGYVSADDFITVEDDEGFRIEPYDSAWGGGEYDPAAGAFFELETGQKAKVGLPYLLSKDTTQIKVIVNNEYEINIKL